VLLALGGHQVYQFDRLRLLTAASNSGDCQRSVPDVLLIERINLIANTSKN